MGAMNEIYRNEIANHGASLINYMGLVDDNGDEIEGGDYERLEVHWADADDGTIRPYANQDLDEDLIFDIPEDTTIGGWRGYSDKEGGTEYGGADLDEPENYPNGGKFQLIGDDSGIKHDA